jgi:hypothetical protein
VENGRVGGFTVGETRACLLLPDGEAAAPLALPAGLFSKGTAAASLIDLSSGSIVDAGVTAAGDGSLGLDPSPALQSPSLVIARRGSH